MTCLWGWIEASALRTLITHPQGLTLIPSTHTPNCLNIQSQGNRQRLLITTGTFGIPPGQISTSKLNFFFFFQDNKHTKNTYLQYRIKYIPVFSAFAGGQNEPDLQGLQLLGGLANQMWCYKSDLGTQEEQYSCNNSPGPTYVITTLNVKVSHCSFCLLAFEGYKDSLDGCQMIQRTEY